MTEAIQEMFKTIFGNNVVLATILISLLPIVELRGAIPFGMSKDIWGSLALSSWESFGFSLLGSCLVVPFLALLLKPILNWLKKTKLFKKIAVWFENLISTKSQNINSKLNEAEKDECKKDETQIVVDEREKNVSARFDKKYWIKFFGVFLFVAIPLPLTGVWTGTAIAVMLNMDTISTCVCVILGNVIAGLIMMTLCAIFPNFTLYILLIFVALTILFLLFNLIKNKIKKSKNKNN